MFPTPINFQSFANSPKHISPIASGYQTIKSRSRLQQDMNDENLYALLNIYSDVIGKTPLIPNTSEHSQPFSTEPDMGCMAVPTFDRRKSVG